MPVLAEPTKQHVVVTLDGGEARESMNGPKSDGTLAAGFIFERVAECKKLLTVENSPSGHICYG